MTSQKGNSYKSYEINDKIPAFDQLQKIFSNLQKLANMYAPLFMDASHIYGSIYILFKCTY